MTSEQETLLVIKGSIASLPKERQEVIETIAENMRRVVRNTVNGEGHMALALVGAELAAQ
jgi:hypothetical protein